VLTFELSMTVIRKPYLPHSGALERASLWLNIGGIWLSSWPVPAHANFAILSDFSGSNLAVPVRYADELVK
jgi:hypothetical protein